MNHTNHTNENTTTMTVASQNKNLRSNVRRNYMFTLLNSFDLTNGVWMLFLAYKGLNLFQIGIMEAIYHLASFTMEVPTGIIADLYGRRTSRILGRAMSVIATTIMLFSDNVFMFGLCFAFSAIGNNLESGAGDALIYDSLKEVGEENTYMKTVGIKEMCFQIARIFGLLLGGYLAQTDYMLVYKAALVVGVLTLAHTFTFKEPSIGKVESEHKGMRLMLEQLRTSLKVLAKDKKIGFLIFACEAFGLFYTTEFFYIQNHMKALGRTEFEVAMVLAAGAVGGAIIATQAHKLDIRFGSDRLLLILPIMAVVGFWLIATPALLPVGFVYLAVVEGMLFVSVSDYVNRLIPSEQRATILSFQSMLFSFLMICLFPVVGIVGDHYGLAIAFVGIAGLATVVLLSISAVVWHTRHHWKTL